VVGPLYGKVVGPLYGKVLVNHKSRVLVIFGMSQVEAVPFPAYVWLSAYSEFPPQGLLAKKYIMEK
jgi:hypothetical protein